MAGSKGRIILHGDPALNPDWEGVIDDIKIESLPIGYITELTLNLKNKQKTIIDVRNILVQSATEDHAAQRVNNIIREHNALIETIDFKVNISGLQKKVDQARAAFTKKVNRSLKRNGTKRGK
jgi:hypothetical protein